MWRTITARARIQGGYSATISNLYEVWKKFNGEARTRILIWYVVTITFIFIISIPAFRILLYTHVDARVHEDLIEKIETFQEQICNGETPSQREVDTDDDDDDIEESQISNLQKEPLKQPSTKEELEDFFKAFLLSQLVDDDTFLIAFVDGKFYKSSPRARPEPLAKDSQLMRRWAKQTQAEQGEEKFPDSDIDSIIYRTQPVKINGETLGVFVVAHTTAGERGEVLEAVAVIIQVSIVVMFVAIILAWVTSGRVLAPLRLLTTTTRSINEFDLEQRIPVTGPGEIAELAATFNEMMDRLQAAFTSQKNFIQDAGHELRTPITIIRGHLELMSDNPQEIQETRAIVLDELDRMSRIVEDLILLAKAERPDFLKLEKVGVLSLTEELFTKARGLGDRNWVLDATADGEILVDRQRITQAVMNLAQNATQYTKNSDTIAIGSVIKKGKVYFWVRDTGEGIAVADQKRIFQRFARAANSRRRSEGAGLGLSIVKAIAETHSGKVVLRSQLGSGAMFTIILPIEPPHRE